MTWSTDPDRLNVWHSGSLIGGLWRDRQDRIGFSYSADWLAQGFRVGRLLPLKPEPFAPEEGLAHAWFSNLLPEGTARERTVRHLGVADDDFVLLREIGGDCAGALSVLPIGQAVDEHAGAEPLDEARLTQILQQRGHGILPGPKNGNAVRPRLSLAGAQSKCPVLIKSGDYLLPRGMAASSHILKFELPEWRHVPVYEVLLNRLAQAVGLPVPETRLKQRHGHRYLVIRRYDREERDGQWHRLHQEDFCQIAGLRATRKYEAEGGPGLAECAQWIRELSARPAEDLLNLLRWQIFNWLAGNSDGNAKNLALVQTPHNTAGRRLAPFYDLVCTRAWPNLGRHLAMSVGGESDPGRISPRHWQAQAEAMGMRPRFVLREVGNMAASIQAALPKVKTDLEQAHGALPMLQQPEKIIRSQLRMAGHRFA